MIEGLEESRDLIQHEMNRLNMMMVGEEWDQSSLDYHAGLDRALELVKNRLNNERLDTNT